MSEKIDLGSGYSYEFTSWIPDRSIPTNAERFADIPNIDPCGIIIHCPHGEGSVMFDLPNMQKLFGHNHPLWEVKSLTPLHIEPSILRKECGCHGFIREGKWISA